MSARSELKKKSAFRVARRRRGSGSGWRGCPGPATTYVAACEAAERLSGEPDGLEYEYSAVYGKLLEQEQDGRIR